MAASEQSKKIGLLGGSFNPAHSGHVYISEHALEILGLDEVRWLISPQNPLKKTEGMASYTERFEKAKEVAACNKRIIVSDFEIHSKTTYTHDTVHAIKLAYPQHNFIWLMGADNILQFPQWHRWMDITKAIPIAVFNRGNLKEKALAGEFATKFANSKENKPNQLVYKAPPAWAFIDIESHPGSATKIRNELTTKK